MLLTDGENTVNGGSNGHNGSAYNTFGYAQSRHLGSSNGREASASLDDKTETVCEKIKGKDILVYTIGFQVSDRSTQTLLKDCATEPDMYYNSPSNDELAAIFQDIAQGLSELRIAQ